MRLHLPLSHTSWPAVAALAATLFACQPDAGPTGLVGSIAASRGGVPTVEGLASPVWQAIAASQVTTARLSPTVTTRFYSLVGVAQYLAVQRAEGADQSDDENEARGRDRRATDRGAVAGASAVVLSYLLSANTQALED